MKKPLIVSRDHDGSLARDYGLCIDIEDSDGKYIGSTQRYEDALEIVRAVNAHEALVRACRMVSAHPDFKCLGCEAAIKEALAIAKEPT